MLDHILGRPNIAVRKYQVFAAVSVWVLYLLRGNRHGPPGLRRLSQLFSSRLSAWQTIIVASLVHYILRNLGKIVGLESPEPLANLYEPAYFRGTWATTALDAGFWTAMTIRRVWLQHIASLVFTVYYLINTEQADEKVRAVRSVITVEHLRNSWNKMIANPLLRTFTRLTRPRTMKYNPREIRIPRPHGSRYTDPVNGWLYYDGPISALKRQTKMILNVPGGGFVAMSPRTHDDALMAWAAKTGLPILSLDYRKAPEYPYPYALHESFDVYRMIIHSQGRCVGLFPDGAPQVIVSGDSAGGSLAAGLTIMAIEYSLSRSHREGSSSIPIPAGLVLVYPCLDVNIGNWMTDEQMALIRDKDSRQTNRRILRRKTSVYMRTAATPYASENDSSDSEDNNIKPFNFTQAPIGGFDGHSDSRPVFHTRVAVPSMISYFSDRMLTPEMMRAIIVLYVGPKSKPNFATDYHLSPVLAPDYILAHFPQTYFLTGERDPLVDDTCIMAGRIRQAKRHAHGRSNTARKANVIKVELVKGISHGFLQMGGVYAKAWELIDTVGEWYDEIFNEADKQVRESHRQSTISRRRTRPAPLDGNSAARQNGNGAGVRSPGSDHKQTETILSAVSDDSDAPLEMSIRPLTAKKQSSSGSARTKNSQSPPKKKKDSPKRQHSGHEQLPLIDTNVAESNEPMNASSISPTTTSVKMNGVVREQGRKMNGRPQVLKFGGDGTGSINGPMSEHSTTPSYEDCTSFEADSPIARQHPIQRTSTWDLHRSSVNLDHAATMTSAGREAGVDELF